MLALAGKSNNTVSDRLTFEVSSKVKNTVTNLEILEKYLRKLNKVVKND